MLYDMDELNSELSPIVEVAMDWEDNNERR